MITEKDTISERAQSTRPPRLWEVATEVVLDTLLYKPIDAFRRLASRSHAPEGLSHQSQEIK